MLVLLCRVLIIYLVVLIYLRIMGKRQLGEMQPFELVITLLIADIAALPMTQTSMPMSFSFIPLTTLVIIHFFVSVCARKSIFLRKVVNGKPVIVVSPDGIQYDSLKQLNMSMDDLMEGIRGCNYFSVEDVLYAIIETNGKMSVIPKKASSNVTVEDAKLELPENTLPLILVSARKMVTPNLKIAKVDKKFVIDTLNSLEITDVKNVLLFTIDTEGECFVETMDGQTYNTKLDYKGDW